MDLLPKKAELPEKEKFAIEINRSRWKTRRQMASFACAAGVLYPGTIHFLNDPDKLNMLHLLSTPFYTFVTLIVLAYIGGAVVDDKLNSTGARDVVD